MLLDRMFCRMYEYFKSTHMSKINKCVQLNSMLVWNMLASIDIFVLSKCYLCHNYVNLWYGYVLCEWTWLQPQYNLYLLVGIYSLILWCVKREKAQLDAVVLYKLSTLAMRNIFCRQFLSELACDDWIKTAPGGSPSFSLF